MYIILRGEVAILIKTEDQVIEESIKRRSNITYQVEGPQKHLMISYCIDSKIIELWLLRNNMTILVR